MRVIALVSLTLALLASSMPVSTNPASEGNVAKIAGVVGEVASAGKGAESSVAGKTVSGVESAGSTGSPVSRDVVEGFPPSGAGGAAGTVSGTIGQIIGTGEGKFTGAGMTGKDDLPSGVGSGESAASGTIGEIASGAGQANGAGGPVSRNVFQAGDTIDDSNTGTSVGFHGHGAA